MNLEWLPQVARLQAVMFLCNACHRDTSHPLGDPSPASAPSTALSEQEIVDHFRWAYRFDPQGFDDVSCSTLIKRREGEVFFLSMSDNSGVPACEFVLYFRSAGNNWTLVEQGRVKGTFRAFAQWSLGDPGNVIVSGMNDKQLRTISLPTKPTK